MKIIKLVLISAAIALFFFACANNNNQPAANLNADTTNGTTVVGNNQPSANFNTANAQTSGDELASAAKIYSEKCIKCHKEDGTGGVTVFEDGTKIKAPNFTSERMKNDKDADWIETINNGAKEDGMPAYKGKISDEDIKNLVKYIHRDFQGK